MGYAPFLLLGVLALAVHLWPERLTADWLRPAGGLLVLVTIVMFVIDWLRLLLR